MPQGLKRFVSKVTWKPKEIPFVDQEDTKKISTLHRADTIKTDADSAGALYVIVVPAVNVKLRGTAAFGLAGVFIVPAAALKTVPVPAVDRIVNGRLKTTVFADVAVLIALRSG